MTRCKKDYLIIEHINARSLLSSFEEIKLLLNERNVDILCVSETWLLPYIPDEFVNIPNYKVFRCDIGRGAGSCIYAKAVLNPSIMNLNVPRQPGVEDVWVKVQCRKLPAIIIGCVYRHPKSLAVSFDYIQDVFKTVCLYNKKVFILGDFNDDLLTKGNRINKVIKSNSLTQIIDRPTRTTHTSATLLDLVITNTPDVIISHDVVPEVIADHDLVSVTVNVGKPKRQRVTKAFRHLGNYDKDTFCSLLLDNVHCFNDMFFTDDVDRQVHIFNDVFIKCLDICAPTVTKVVKRQATPWMNDDIRKAMNDRNEAQCILKNDRQNIFLQQNYKAAKKFVKTLIKNSTADHYRNRLVNCRGKTDDTWKVVREMVPSQKNTHNNPYNFENKIDKAEEFNNFFSKVGENTYKRSQEQLDIASESVIQHLLPNSEVNVPFRPNPVDIDTIILTVKHLNETNSVGSDGISLMFLKHSLFATISYITCIINTSLVTGRFPKAWKHAMVVPLLKNGDPNCVNNYRPISLLPVISKVLERIVANQITSYLESNKLFSNSQHGFRSKLSTESALTTITDKLYENMDKKHVSLLTLCDLSKAFDSVSHDILLKKCYKLNIDDFWLNSYLSERTMSVRLNNVISNKQKIGYGVPQGSILGPILFGIYVNDLSDHINCPVVQYADDTQFLFSSTIDNLNQLIQDTEEVFVKCKNYFLSNGLMLNSNKTQCIFVGNRQLLSRIPPNTVINCDGANIQPSNSVKNLGVYIDRYMLFDVHVNEVNKKAMGILFYINRIGNNFDKSSRILVIQSLVLSLVYYCIRIWGTCNETIIHNVQKLQNFAAKVAVGGARKYDHVTPFFNELKWLKVKQKHLLDVCTTVYKAVRGTSPDWLLSFRTIQDITNSVTRKKDTLYIPRTRTECGARSLTVLGPKLWNKLPTNVTQAKTVNSFKYNLTKFLLSDRCDM